MEKFTLFYLKNIKVEFALTFFFFFPQEMPDCIIIPTVSKVLKPKGQGFGFYYSGYVNIARKQCLKLLTVIYCP